MDENLLLLLLLFTGCNKNNRRRHREGLQTLRQGKFAAKLTYIRPNQSSEGDTGERVC